MPEDGSSSLRRRLALLISQDRRFAAQRGEFIQVTLHIEELLDALFCWYFEVPPVKVDVFRATVLSSVDLMDKVHTLTALLRQEGLGSDIAVHLRRVVTFRNQCAHALHAPSDEDFEILELRSYSNTGRPKSELVGESEMAERIDDAKAQISALYDLWGQLDQESSG